MESYTSGVPRDMRQLLCHRSQTTPDAMAYTFLKDGAVVDGSYTYAELDLHARSIAKALGPEMLDQRVLLIYPPGVEFLAGFYGAMYAGAIPVPAPPPDMARLKRTLPRLKSIIKDADARCILTTRSMAESMRANEDTLSELSVIDWIITDEVDPSDGTGWDRIPPKSTDDVAYLQYTSGSTSTPKGVMITYGNVMHNCMHLTEGFGYDEHCVMVTWMPYFHDYGLIDGLSNPMYHGFPCYILSPLTFVRRPETWLDVISRYKATHTQAPNFAYELCVRKIDDKVVDRLDLSCLITASTGGEPVRAETVREFTRKFARCGLKPEAVCPACGLAESTLVISAKTKEGTPYLLTVDKTAYKNDVIIPLEHDDPNGWTLVSSGKILSTVGVAIVDMATMKRLPDGMVGELWTSGGSVGAGYWQREEESEATFRARIHGEEHLGLFLRTGDLAFVYENQVFITGRAKDLVIIDGTNHYPQDIELTVQNAHPAIRVDHCAVFSVDIDDRERLVVVAEADKKLDDWKEVLRVIRREISEVHELELYAFQVIRRGAIHKTSSGKLQRSACRAAFLEGDFESIFTWTRPFSSPTNSVKPDSSTSATTSAATANTLQRSAMMRSIRAIVIDELGIETSELSDHRPLAEYGMSSRVAVMIASRLEELSSGAVLPSTILWEHPTIEALATYLLNPSQKVNEFDVFSTHAGEPIAIVGMACRFPGAPHLEAFWELLLSGRDAITDVPPDRWDADELFAKEAGTPGRINNRKGGFIDRIDHFDAAFFGISPSEATVMDPQQRLLLECVWHAFEHAQIDTQKLAGTDTGVFVGISTNDYQELQMADRSALNPYTGPGKSFSIAANRLSYIFDFRGPSMSIDTACSSSLVAVHQAVQSLRRRESSTAVAAGVNLLITPEMSIALSQAQMLSPDGRCKSFDDGANGYVRSEGVGSVVLKRLSDAQNDGDRVIAVIRGGAINQDGRSNGLTAPNASAQREVIHKALHDAGVSPEQIGYVEAHGTGTALGDPIEVRSIQEVLGKGRPMDRACTIGSVKSNIGHLEAAAGMAGLIKTALVLSRGVIPTTAGFTSLNKQIHLADTPFTIAAGTNPWEVPNRFAGVSSFGFGGANAHVVLEAPPAVVSQAEATDSTRWWILPVSARTSPSFTKVVQEHIAAIQQLDASQLTDYCHAIATGRSSLPLRAAFAGRGTDELIEAMQRHDGNIREAASDQSVWLFTGQGSQYTGMARMWYESIPAFRAKIDEFDRLLGTYWTHSLRELLWDADRTPDLDQTQFTQAALFAIQIAMVETLRSWGLQPDAVAGYSVGEYTAACVAGIFSAEDGLKLLAERGRLVQAHGKPGSMMAVIANEELSQQLASKINGLQIATINGRAGTVLAGPESALADLAAHSEKYGIEYRRLNVSHAFHSALMEDVIEPFAEVLSGVTFSKASIPLVSNLTGSFEQGEMSEPKYWLRHLLEPVRFGDSMQTLFDHGFSTFLEIGPKPVLCGMASRFDGADGLGWIPIMRQDDDEERVLLEALGSLWSQGVDVDWTAIMPKRDKGTLRLPLYPFDRARYWLEPQKQHSKARGSAKGALVGTATYSKLIKGTLFESSLGVETHPLYSDHKVFDVLVVPAAGHLALLMEATGKIWNDSPILFDQVVFTKPLVIHEDTPSELRLFVEDSGSFSLVDETSQYIPLASGIARISSALVPPNETLREVEQRCDREIINSFYDSHWQKNIVLGPAFRHITQVHVGQGELLASLSADPTWEGQLDDLHPGLIDSMLQTLTVLVSTQDDEVTIPFTFEQVRYHRKSKGCAGYKSHLSLVESSDDRAVSNVRVWELMHDGSSRILLEIDRFVAMKVKKKLLLQEMRSGSNPPSYELAWIPIEQVGTFDPTIDLPTDWKAYIGGDDLQEAATPVLSIRSVSSKHMQSTSAALADIAIRLTHIATWCRSENKPLVIITHGAYSIEEADGTDAFQTAIAALARQMERELLPGRLLHIDLPATEHVEPLVTSGNTTILFSKAADRLVQFLLTGFTEVAWRRGQLCEPVFQPVTSIHQSTEAVPGISSQGRYVITGGSGALAKQVAIWLAERGAGQVDLLGRRNKSDELAEWLETSFDNGNVRYTAVDITDRYQLLAEMAKPDALPIKGIFHLAGTLNDRLLQEATTEAFEQVLAPKVDGLLNLHNASLGLELDHFVVFSSASSVLVTPGQANYAMANAFMDGFIVERRRHGLPGVSLCWGPFASGMAMGLEEHFAKQGIRLLEETSMGALSGFLSESTPAAMLIMDADWDIYAAFNGSPSRIRGLTQRRDTRSSPEQSGFLSELKAASDKEKSSLVESEIRKQVALFLHKPDPKAIPARKRLFEMGLDSLGAVELKNRLAAALSKELRSTLLFDYPTIEDLIAHLTPLVVEGNLAVSSSPARSANGLNRVPSPTGGALGDLEDQASPVSDDELYDLSEDELAELLRKELGDG